MKVGSVAESVPQIELTCLCTYTYGNRFQLIENLPHYASQVPRTVWFQDSEHSEHFRHTAESTRWYATPATLETSRAAFPRLLAHRAWA
jgi:hypothetical protein